MVLGDVSGVGRFPLNPYKFQDIFRFQLSLQKFKGFLKKFYKSLGAFQVSMRRFHRYLKFFSRSSNDLLKRLLWVLHLL